MAKYKKIKGYRDLSQAEIDLMNRIKAHAEVTKELIQEVQTLRVGASNEILQKPSYEVTEEGLTLQDLEESQRCLALAKTNLQQGFMWFVRAVALPQSF